MQARARACDVQLNTLESFHICGAVLRGTLKGCVQEKASSLEASNSEAKLALDKSVNDAAALHVCWTWHSDMRSNIYSGIQVCIQTCIQICSLCHSANEAAMLPMPLPPSGRPPARPCTPTRTHARTHAHTHAQQAHLGEAEAKATTAEREAAQARVLFIPSCFQTVKEKKTGTLRTKGTNEK